MDTGTPTRHLAAANFEESDWGRAGLPSGRSLTGEQGRVGANMRGRTAELHGVHSGLTRRQASARRTPAARSRGPRTSANLLTPRAQTLPLTHWVAITREPAPPTTRAQAK